MFDRILNTHTDVCSKFEHHYTVFPVNSLKFSVKLKSEGFLKASSGTNSVIQNGFFVPSVVPRSCGHEMLY